MLNKFKNAIYNVVSGGVDAEPLDKDADHKDDSKTLSHKFPYTRPHFLQLNLEEEVQLSADKQIRPIIVPRDISKLPWNSGYAEAVNAGKSLRNEDQACIRRAILQHPESKDNLTLRSATFQSSEANNPAMSLPYVYFSVFDGHAGAGAAVAAANQLHHIIHEKLVDIIDHLLPPLDGISAHQIEATAKRGVAMWFPEKEVSQEALIVGALEIAFWEMDNLIAGDRKKFNIKGGCTALVALFILGRVYVANAGDSRAVMVKNKVASALSTDFTPESERGRVRRLAASQPHLLGGEFTHLDFKRRPLARDLGKRVLFRDAHMMGWAYKTVTPDDLKIPVVHGEGKRSRVLATIGVTRGFGDHDLKALNCNILIKPFLLSQPEVHILDVSNDDFVLADTDVLLMGTDGLWDVTTNDRAAEILQKSFDHFPSSDTQRLKYRFTSAAQDLVMQSRGKLHERNWRTSDGKPASTDDISVFVIPLAQYKDEYVAWKRDYDGIRGMYDNDKDSSKGFGKLSLRTSPVASEKMSPHFEASSERRGCESGPSNKDSSKGFGKLSLRTSPVASEKMSPHFEASNERRGCEPGPSNKSGHVYVGIVNCWEETPTVEMQSLPNQEIEWKLHRISFSPGREPLTGRKTNRDNSVASEDSRPGDIPTKRGRYRIPSARENAMDMDDITNTGENVVTLTDRNIDPRGTRATQPELNTDTGGDETDREIVLKQPEPDNETGADQDTQSEHDIETSGTLATQLEHDTISNESEDLQEDIFSQESQDPGTQSESDVDATSPTGIVEESSEDDTPHTQATSISGPSVCP